MHQEIVDPFFERARIAEIANPDRAAPDLVLISGTDAAPSRADALVAAARLAGAVEPPVRRQDQRGVVGELKIPRRDVEALLAHRLDLVEERPRIDDDPVADDRQF